MRGIRYAAFDGAHIVRHAVDQVGNDLTCVLAWCNTHVEPVWVYGDGSFQCPHDLVVGWDSDGGHEIIAFPWPLDGGDA